jgi:hypothetical protein
MKRLWIAPLLAFAMGCAGEVGPVSAPGGAQVSPQQPIGSAETSPAVTSATALEPAPDAGFPDAGSTLDAGIQRVPVIVAQGYMGRTTLSCDDGLTWIANRSFDLEGDDLVCNNTAPVQCGVTSCTYRWTDGSCTTQAVCDCAHGPGYGKGVAVADDQILANFGWGYPGKLMRSLDGATWNEALHLDMALYPNIVYGANRFVLYTGFKPAVSDDGVNWRYTTPANLNEGGRAVAFLDYGSGRFIATQDGDIIRVSSDRGETWHQAASVPPDCIKGIGTAQKIATGNGIAVMVSDVDRMACRSADGGETWTRHKIVDLPGGIFFQYPSFANGKFLAWGLDFSTNQGWRYSSTDGITWVAEKTTGPIWIGPNGVSTSGALIATNGDQYGKQKIMRSTDNGLTWVEIPTSNFVQSHAFTRFAAGYIAANTLCK